MKNEALRDTLVQQAEASFISFTTQIDYLLDLVGFYLDRYPPDGSLGCLMKSMELKETIDNIASLTSQLADVVTRWKEGQDRVLSRTGTELNILNELNANAQALIYFLLSNHIDLEPFDVAEASTSFILLTKCNRLLT